MKDHPILFTGENVRAILEDRKTQTRRVVRVQPPSKCPYPLPKGDVWIWTMIEGQEFPAWAYHTKCPYGKAGDRLWARETFREFDDGDVFRREYYGKSVPVHADDDPADWKWTPSIFMPKRLARIYLDITDIRVERLQDISEADAKAEGVIDDRDNMGWDNWYGVHFRKLWESINAKKHPWESNPWLWVVSFRRLKIDAKEG